MEEKEKQKWKGYKKTVFQKEDVNVNEDLLIECEAKTASLLEFQFLCEV